jgi:hypothetical protein
VRSWRTGDCSLGATANPATGVSPGTIRDTIADMVARIVGHE